MIRFRWYYDKDKEQEWLMRMSERGWAMTGFFLGFYYFTKCEPNEYSYQIDLREEWFENRDAYAAFMKEADVEVVAWWFRWVYLRRKTSDEPFELYSDMESKIMQYQRIRELFRIVAVIEAICSFIELFAAVGTNYSIFWFLTVLFIALTGCFLRIINKCNSKIDMLNAMQK